MADGVKVTGDAAGRRTALYTGALLCAGGLLGLAAALWLFDGDVVEGKRQPEPVAAVADAESDETEAPSAPVERVVTHVARAAERRDQRSSKPASLDSATDPATKEKAEPEIKAGEYIEALRAAGETGGIAAFNPPGTDPIKSGIIVPDEYELPPGYARRYQTNDDGTDVPPILSFSPGFEFLDSDGNAIPIPDDLIVPPEMAPPDLPIRMLNPRKYAGR